MIMFFFKIRIIIKKIHRKTHWKITVTWKISFIVFLPSVFWVILIFQQLSFLNITFFNMVYVKKIIIKIALIYRQTSWLMTLLAGSHFNGCDKCGTRLPVCMISFDSRSLIHLHVCLMSKFNNSVYLFALTCNGQTQKDSVVKIPLLLNYILLKKYNV